jgi:hypothetical protein
MARYCRRIGSRWSASPRFQSLAKQRGDCDRVPSGDNHRKSAIVKLCSTPALTRGRVEALRGLLGRRRTKLNGIGNPRISQGAPNCAFKVWQPRAQFAAKADIAICRAAWHEITSADVQLRRESWRKADHRAEQGRQRTDDCQSEFKTCKRSLRSRELV